MSNVKKIGIYLLIILCIVAASFFCGYSYAGSKYNDIDIRESTKLIREQDAPIKAIGDQLSNGIEQSDVIIGEGEDIKGGIDNIENDIREVTDGLSADTEGLQSVIDRLKYYQIQAEPLAEDSHN